MLGCRTSGGSAELHTLVGTLVVTGNEPFTNLSLQSDNTTVSVIRKDTTEIYRNLWKLQGRKVRVWFQADNTRSNLSKLTIERYEIVKDH